MLSLKVRGSGALRPKLGWVGFQTCDAEVKSVHHQNYQLILSQQTSPLGDTCGPTGGYVCLKQDGCEG